MSEATNKQKNEMKKKKQTGQSFSNEERTGLL